MKEKLEKFIVEPEAHEGSKQYTQKEISVMENTDLDDLHKGDFIRADGKFAEVEHVKWEGENGFVVLKNGKRHEVKNIRTYKKNPERR
jgi:hypothetical protein